MNGGAAGGLLRLPGPVFPSDNSAVDSSNAFGRFLCDASGSLLSAIVGPATANAAGGPSRRDLTAEMPMEAMRNSGPTLQELRRRDVVDRDRNLHGH